MQLLYTHSPHKCSWTTPLNYCSWLIDLDLPIRSLKEVVMEIRIKNITPRLSEWTNTNVLSCRSSSLRRLLLLLLLLFLSPQEGEINFRVISDLLLRRHLLLLLLSFCNKIVSRPQRRGAACSVGGKGHDDGGGRNINNFAQLEKEAAAVLLPLFFIVLGPSFC